MRARERTKSSRQPEIDLQPVKRVSTRDGAQETGFATEAVEQPTSLAIGGPPRSLQPQLYSSPPFRSSQHEIIIP